MRFDDVEELLLLIGSNPFPNVLAALIFKPDKVHLFYSTKGTKRVKEQIRDILKKKLGLSDDDLIDEPLSNPFDAKKVNLAFEKSSFDIDNAHLNYTGGTKVMAAQARMVFGDRENQVSYIVENKSQIRFDDGFYKSLNKFDIDLTIDDVFDMHGMEYSPRPKLINPKPTENDVDLVKAFALQSFKNIKWLHGLHYGKDKLSDAWKRKINLAKVLPNLSIDQLPSKGFDEDTYKHWKTFLDGTWSELWLYRILQECYPELDHNYLRQNVECQFQSNDRYFEVDIVLIRKHRLFAISCTTSLNLKRCKLKLFEIVQRARQLGGDLARPALFCLLGHKDLNRLRFDVGQIWDSPQRPEVFGKPDAEAWNMGHYNTLVNWIEQTE